MASGYLSSSMKIKRKDLEDVSDEFSDFSLSSPARKIRRLDAELPPIIEEDEPSWIPLDLDPQPQTEELELDLTPTLQSPNEERALVLYNPGADKSLLHRSLGSSGVSITVSRDLFPNLENGVLWSTSPSDLLKSAQDNSQSGDKNDKTNNCLAVVPWVSNHLMFPPESDEPAIAETSEPMEAEDVGSSTMEIEEESVAANPPSLVNASGWGQAEGFQQWQQQHCMTPQVPPSAAATPIMWSL